jgi:3,4-dihydroxy 2-butanone 4-phosphate synthase/GTP cyclohydrolase II
MSKTSSSTEMNVRKATPKVTLNSIEEAILDIRDGKVVIVVDDEDRENEGDFVCAAQCITPEIINFMATHGRGLICAPIDEIRADELDLKMMVPENTSLHETAFTVSIDLIGKGCTTGISAYDRAMTIKALVDRETVATDFARPGHIFPLRAKSGGVLRRTGHTEASIDLARLAGFAPAGVLVEILHENGTMARLPELVKIAKRFSLKIIAIRDLVEYRMQKERLIKRELSLEIPTRFGTFEAIIYSQINTGDMHLVLKKGTWTDDEPVLVKTYSSHDTGDMVGLILKGYGTRLEKALDRIAHEGKGVLLCMRHSEKSHDLVTALKLYRQQLEIGTPLEKKNEQEQRDFGIGAQIFRDLGITNIRLLSKQPPRRIGLIGYGLQIVETIEF